MRELLHFLLAEPVDDAAPETESSLASWWEERRDLRARFASPIDRAIAGGRSAGRLGFAFAAGYHAALSALFPSIGDERFAALCATEEGGARPRAIRTSLSRGPDGR